MYRLATMHGVTDRQTDRHKPIRGLPTYKSGLSKFMNIYSAVTALTTTRI